MVRKQLEGVDVTFYKQPEQLTLRGPGGYSQPAGGSECTAAFSRVRRSRG